MDFVTIKYNSSGLITSTRTLPENQVITPVIKKAIAIYPNPAYYFFTVQLPAEDFYDLTITDATGRKIFEEKNMKAQSLINCEKFAKGTYFVKAGNNERVSIQKIIKQ